MPSSFTWLDYSEQERRKMLDVIELFGEKTTRDELGLGGVRDAFADLLFPGTSTIQTRAKYFLFVPWIYGQLEAKQVASAAVPNRARKLETELMYALEKSGDATGLIGRRAKENVRRLASSVYWMGLSSWGIRAFPGSQDQYHRSLDLHYLRQRGRRANKHEFDGEAQNDPDLSNWHDGLPQVPVSFPNPTAFALSQAEAEYLRERVLTNCSESLLAYILRERLPIEESLSCWDLTPLVPSVFREQLSHGRNFSEIMLGAQLLYNLMLAELLPSQELMSDYESLLSDWCRTINDRRGDFDAWDRQRFWQIVRSANPRLSLRAQTFVSEWIKLVLSSKELTEFIKNQKARSLIDQREQALKRGQSRLHSRRALELWNGASGAGQMDLRWTAAKRILSDILQGLEALEDA